MSSAPSKGKNTTATDGSFGGVGKPERTKPHANPTPSPSGVKHAPTPERTASKAGGDFETPPSTRSNIVQPATPPTSTEDPGVKNLGK